MTLQSFIIGNRPNYCTLKWEENYQVLLGFIWWIACLILHLDVQDPAWATYITSSFFSIKANFIVFKLGDFFERSQKLQIDLNDNILKQTWTIKLPSALDWKKILLWKTNMSIGRIYGISLAQKMCFQQIKLPLAWHVEWSSIKICILYFIQDNLLLQPSFAQPWMTSLIYQGSRNDFLIFGHVTKFQPKLIPIKFCFLRVFSSSP